jgi:hypothetical protein
MGGPVHTSSRMKLTTVVGLTPLRNAIDYSELIRGGIYEGSSFDGCAFERGAAGLNAAVREPALSGAYISNFSP